MRMTGAQLVQPRHVPWDKQARVNSNHPTFSGCRREGIETFSPSQAFISGRLTTSPYGALLSVARSGLELPERVGVLWDCGLGGEGTRKESSNSLTEEWYLYA
jgi:hypothetical protein